MRGKRSREFPPDLEHAPVVGSRVSRNDRGEAGPRVRIAVTPGDDPEVGHRCRHVAELKLRERQSVAGLRVIGVQCERIPESAGCLGKFIH